MASLACWPGCWWRWRRGRSIARRGGRMPRCRRWPIRARDPGADARLGRRHPHRQPAGTAGGVQRRLRGDAEVHARVAASGTSRAWDANQDEAAITRWLAGVKAGDRQRVDVQHRRDDGEVIDVELQPSVTEIGGELMVFSSAATSRSSGGCCASRRRCSRATWSAWPGSRVARSAGATARWSGCSVTGPARPAGRVGAGVPLGRRAVRGGGPAGLRGLGRARLLPLADPDAEQDRRGGVGGLRRGALVGHGDLPRWRSTSPR